MANRLGFKTQRLLAALVVVCSALGFSLLSLGLSVDYLQAAPLGQEGTLVLPVMNNPNQTSVYTVTNLSSEVITVRHEFYSGGYPNGQFIAVLTDTQTVAESKLFTLNLIPNFPKTFQGQVVISANQPITGSAIVKAIVLSTPTPVPPPVSVPASNQALPPLPSLNPNRVDINWTLVTYIIVGIFALSGFFKGWWKETITTLFVGVLIFFLATPVAAEWFINRVNEVLVSVWAILARSGVVPTGNVFQLNSASKQTWLVILLICVGLAIFISRASLPSMTQGRRAFSAYVVTPIGSILGAILGGFNGFLIITLIKQYLDGANLPGGGQSSNINVSGGGVATTLSGFNIQVTDLSSFLIFSALLPWLIIIFVLIILFLMRRNRVTPWGYVKYSIEKDKDKTIFVAIPVKK